MFTPIKIDISTAIPYKLTKIRNNKIVVNSQRYIKYSVYWF